MKGGLKMKRLISFIVAVLMCVTFNSTAFADVMGIWQVFVPYDVVVTQQGGSQVYGYDNGGDFVDMDGFVPFGQRLTVQSEYTFDGEKFVYAVHPDTCDGAYYKASTLTLAEDLYPPENGVKHSYKKAYVKDTGLFLLKGPSDAFEVSSEEIPVGTELEYEVSTANGGTWGYTSYNGKYGWFIIHDSYSGGDLYKYKCKVAEWVHNYNLNLGKLYVIGNGYELHQQPSKSSPCVGGKIEPHTELYYQYSFIDGYDEWVLTEHGGMSGWLCRKNGYDGEVVRGAVSSLLPLDISEFTLYERPLDTSSKVDVKIPENQSLSFDYEIYDDTTGDYWSKISIYYGGQCDFDGYWAKYSSGADVAYPSSDRYITGADKTPLYVFPRDTAEIADYMEKDVEIKAMYIYAGNSDPWIGFAHNGKIVWADCRGMQFVSHGTLAETTDPYPVTQPFPVTQPLPESDSEITEAAVTSEEIRSEAPTVKKTTLKPVIFFSAMAAGVIIVTAGIIVFIKKRNK